MRYSACAQGAHKGRRGVACLTTHLVSRLTWVTRPCVLMGWQGRGDAPAWGAATARGARFNAGRERARACLSTMMRVQGTPSACHTGADLRNERQAGEGVERDGPGSCARSPPHTQKNVFFRSKLTLRFFSPVHARPHPHCKQSPAGWRHTAFHHPPTPAPLPPFLLNNATNESKARSLHGHTPGRQSLDRRQGDER